MILTWGPSSYTGARSVTTQGRQEIDLDTKKRLVGKLGGAYTLITPRASGATDGTRSVYETDAPLN